MVSPSGVKPSTGCLKHVAFFVFLIASKLAAESSHNLHGLNGDTVDNGPLYQQENGNDFDLPEVDECAGDVVQISKEIPARNDCPLDGDQPPSVDSGDADNDIARQHHLPDEGEAEEEEEEEEEEGSNEDEIVPLLQERGIYVTNTIAQIDRLTDEARRNDRYPLVIAVAFKPTCRQSTGLVELLEESIPLMQEYLESIKTDGDDQALGDWTLPVFCKIDVDEFLSQEEEKVAERVLLTLGVTSLPSLFFIQMLETFSLENMDDAGEHNNDGEDQEKGAKFYFLDYAGLQSTSSELSAGLWHYIYRLRLGNSHRYRRYPTHSTAAHQNHYKAKREARMTSNGLDHFTDPPYAVVLDDIHQLQTLLKEHGRGLFSRVTPALDPHWSQEEREAIQYILGENLSSDIGEESIHTPADDPYIVVCQCQRSSASNGVKDRPSEGYYGTEGAKDVYNHFDEIARVLSLRRDILFVVLETSCQLPEHLLFGADPSNINTIEDEDVAIFWLDDDWNFGRAKTWKSTISPSLSSVQVDKTSSSDPSNLWLEQQQLQILSSLKEFISSAITPSLLWLDRQQTAPIAFARQNKIHAVLFVDMHHCHSSSSVSTYHESSRNAVYQLRRACQKERESDEAHQMTCLVVPSTDTRILTTFGVDIWTPLDYQVTAMHSAETGDKEGFLKQEGGGNVDVLPTLLITDQRGAGVKRYYLDPPEILNPRSISDFVQAFWRGDLNYEYDGGSNCGGDRGQSRTNSRADDGVPRPPRNRDGVQELTSDHIDQWMNPSTASGGHEYIDMHLLLLIYSPTCGHCKRTSIIWNKLSELIQSLEWDSFVHVAKLDVTKNELFVPGMVVSWLPDVYYVGPHPKEANNGNASRRLIHYDRVDGLGEGVGGLNDTIGIIQWLLDVAELDEPALLFALESQDHPKTEPRVPQATE